MPRTLVLAMGWSLAVACQPPPEEKEVPVIPEVPDPTDFAPTDTFDSGLVAADTKYARELRIVAFIGWNALTQQVQDIRIDGGFYISGFEMQLSVADGANSPDEMDRCSIVVRLSGFGADEPTTPDEMFRLSVPAGLKSKDVPGGEKQVFANCEERMFTGEQYPKGWTMEDYWAAMPWTIAMVQGALDPDLEQRLIDSKVDPNEYAQGTQSGVFESGRFGHLTYWRAYQMDESGVVEGKAGQITAPRLTRDEMLAGVAGTPPTAYYVFDQLVQWNLPDQLDVTPE